MTFRKTIEFPDQYVDVPTWGGQTFRVNLNDLCPDGLREVFTYGLGRKLRDGNHPAEYAEHRVKIRKGNQTKTIGEDEKVPEGWSKVGREPVPESKRDTESRKAIAQAGAEATWKALCTGTFRESRGRRVEPRLKWAREYISNVLVRNGLKVSQVPAMPNMAAAQDVAKRIGLDWAKVDAYVDEMVAKVADVPDVEIDLSKL